ncbi:hypothetical protein [Bifidobacterium sp. ESL0745]|uniref:hypothetical protein n=1 Tax=Bifidobacterium sp. ESL0745 TaxID=2983226 RepID=UPI0023F69DBC|nr:hypothetical protein [Bifidobacterium sp. ESL0745]MDF7664743.1 hypothetical protein [Bifidobacterium sp. ESL0745]
MTYGGWPIGGRGVQRDESRNSLIADTVNEYAEGSSFAEVMVNGKRHFMVIRRKRRMDFGA